MGRPVAVLCREGRVVFESRPLEDPTEIRRNQRRLRRRSLRWVLLIIAVLMGGMALADHLLAPPGESRWFISLSMGGLALVFYRVLSSARRRWEIPLMVVSVLVFGAWAVVAYGSVRSASTLALLGVVVMAGTYLTQRLMLLTALCVLTILGGLTWVEAGGLLVRPTFAADMRFWLMGCVIFLVVGALLDHMRRATDEAQLQRLHQVEERLRLEEERDQSLRRFGRVFRLNPTALMIQFASSQSIMEVNPAFERSLGYSGDQLVGQQADAFWADAQQCREHHGVLFERGRTEWQRCPWRRSDGAVVDVMVYSELSEDPGGMLIMTTVTDVDEAAFSSRVC